MTTRVCALVTDLMDRSRLQEATPEGVDVQLFRSPAPLWDAIGQGGGSGGDLVVILDLARPGVIASIPERRPAHARLLGFGPHVDDELLAAARAAGVDEVLPRSVFFRRLRAILGGDDRI